VRKVSPFDSGDVDKKIPKTMADIRELGVDRDGMDDPSIVYHADSH
jgi:hypothetical protein